MWEFLFSPQGRITRKAYWLGFIVPYFLAVFGGIALDFALFAPIDATTYVRPPVFHSIALLFFLWPSIAVPVKRLHDRGMTGWWVAAPLAVIIVASVLFAAMGGGRTESVDDMPLPAQFIALATVLALAVAVFYPAINIMFLRGQKGPNKHGPDPLGDQAETFA
jgi:uncharacterized membrane protein YhaH (DUF805 family)